LVRPLQMVVSKQSAGVGGQTARHRSTKNPVGGDILTRSPESALRRRKSLAEFSRTLSNVLKNSQRKQPSA